LFGERTISSLAWKKIARRVLRQLENSSKLKKNQNLILLLRNNNSRNKRPLRLQNNKTRKKILKRKLYQRKNILVALTQYLARKKDSPVGRKVQMKRIQNHLMGMIK